MTRDKEWLLREKYHGEKTEGFFTDCKRLEAGEPLGYVIGFVPFLDCQIWLDSYPLIPRPETEYWIEEAIKAITHHQPAPDENLPRVTLGRPSRRVRVLDLCAGSGAIGVAVAKAIPEAHVTFVEIDPLHLPTIEKNLHQNFSVNRKVLENKFLTESNPDTIPVNWNSRFSVLQSDLFANINSNGGEKFDYILSNPPYIDARANTVEKSVVDYEPHLALFGGEAGMEIIERIVAGARAKLAPQGQLWLEHEPFQTTSLTNLAQKYEFSIETKKDQYDTERYSVLTPLMAQ